MGASWQAFYAHLCAASIIRAMPETEIPPRYAGGSLLYPALPTRPSQAVVVVKSGKDDLSQTPYLQNWPKSAFEIVVRVGRKKNTLVECC